MHWGRSPLLLIEAIGFRRTWPSRKRSSSEQVEFKGIQGATQHLVAAFWIADTSSEPCTLESPVEIDLTNGSGVSQMSATSTISPVPLTAGGTIPPGNVAPPIGLAYLAMWWPDDASFAGAHRPTPDFVPASAHIMFADSGDVVVSDLVADNQQVAVCSSGSQSIFGAGPLS